jgi:hypothetical protein
MPSHPCRTTPDRDLHAPTGRTERTPCEVIRLLRSHSTGFRAGARFPGARRRAGQSSQVLHMRGAIGLDLCGRGGRALTATQLGRGGRARFSGVHRSRGEGVPDHVNGGRPGRSRGRPRTSSSAHGRDGSPLAHEPRRGARRRSAAPGPAKCLRATLSTDPRGPLLHGSGYVMAPDPQMRRDAYGAPAPHPSTPGRRTRPRRLATSPYGQPRTWSAAAARSAETDSALRSSLPP